MTLGGLCLNFFVVVVRKVELRCGGGVYTAQKEQGVMLLVSIWELQTHA